MRKTFIHGVAAAISCTAIIVACELPTRPRTVPGEVSRLDVSPKLVTLQQNQAADFTAIGFTTTGDTASVAVTWSVTSGSIIDTSTSNGRHNGRYRAGADTGNVRVIAKGNSGRPADTAIVTVTLAPVTTVVVSPAAPSVQVGQTVQLAATPQDQDGNPLTGRTVTWATSNAAVATVSGTGLVSGGATGTATITASSEGRNGTATITVTNVPVATVSVSPATASLQVGQTVQLTASPKDASGNPLTGRVVTWTSSAPGVASVNGSGLVTSVAAGSATITATSEGRSGTAAVTVTAPAPAPVASVTVSPATVSLGVGGTQQLTATLRDASGNVLTGRVVTWASSNVLVGTVSGNGLVTGLVAGSATITAMSEGQNGSAALTVSVLPPPQLWPNEPAGFTTVVNRPFDAVAELGWGASSLLTLVTDLTAPKSAPLVGQITFPAGFGGGYEPAATWTDGVDSRGFTRMYLSFWVKLSSNWQGHNSGVNKIGFVWMHNNPVVYFSEQGSGSGNLEAQLRLQNTPAPARNLTPNLAAVSLTRGQWHRWEVVIVANTGDQANGEAHWWIDGVKVGEYTDVLYGSSAQPKAWGGPEISWMPIWGGIGDTVAQTMYMWMDHMYISGRQ